MALCDLDREGAKQLGSPYGVGDYYSNLGDMLDAVRPDFVDLATPPETHVGLVEEAARCGVPILCQKPMAPSMEEARQMVRTCRERGVRLMINENWRWQPWYREIKRLLDSGDLPRPFAVQFLHRAADGGGPNPYPAQPYFLKMPRLLIFETLVHYLDTCRFLFGEPESVYCRTERINPVIAGEDLAFIHLEFRGGPWVVIDGNRCAPPGEEGPTYGRILFEAPNQRAEIQADGRIYMESGGARNQHPYTIPSAGYRGDSCRATQSHFIDCLISGKEFETGGEEYLKTFQLVFDCYQSAETGRRVYLKHSV